MRVVKTDNFNSDLGWEKAFTAVDSTFAVSGGVGTITRGANYTVSNQTRPDFYANNFFLGLDLIETTNQPVIALSQTDGDNLLLVWVTNVEGTRTMKVSKRVSGTTTELQATSIPDALAGDTLRLEITKMGTALFVSVLLAGKVKAQNWLNTADISAQNGYKNGISLITEGTQSIDNVEFVNLDDKQHTNIIAIGDSNTNFSGLDTEQEYSWKMHNKKKYKGFTAINKGVGGDSTVDMTDRFTADVLNNKVDGARNVCVILAGTNDSHWNDAPATWGRIETMKDNAIAEGFEVVICTYPQAGNHPFASGKVAFLDALRTLIVNAQPTGNFHLADVYDAFGCTAGSTQVNLSYVFADNQLHANETGHNVIGNTTLEAMGETVGRQSIT